jgi:hypothetical protein
MPAKNFFDGFGEHVSAWKQLLARFFGCTKWYATRIATYDLETKMRMLVMEQYAQVLLSYSENKKPTLKQICREAGGLQLNDQYNNNMIEKFLTELLQLSNHRSELLRSIFQCLTSTNEDCFNYIKLNLSPLILNDMFAATVKHFEQETGHNIIFPEEIRSKFAIQDLETSKHEVLDPTTLAVVSQHKALITNSFNRTTTPSPYTSEEEGGFTMVKSLSQQVLCLDDLEATEKEIEKRPSISMDV